MQPPQQPLQKPAAPPANPSPAPSQAPTQQGQPMAPNGAGAPAAPMDPAAMGATPGQPRLQRLTPDQFEMTSDSPTHKEWSLKETALPENMEAVVISMMSDGDGARYQWMIDPLDGPPVSGQAKTAPEAMMALREALTSHVATSAMSFMGGAAKPGDEGGEDREGPEEPGEAPEKPAGGASLLERLRQRLASAGGAQPSQRPAAPSPGSPPPASPPSKPQRPLRKALDEALDLMAADFAEMDIVKSSATGEDLRDILSSATLEKLTSMVSAESAESNQEQPMPNIDIDALADSIPDEVLDYVEELEAENARLASLTKRLQPSQMDEDEIAKALSVLPPDLAAIVKSSRDEAERLAKKVAEAEIAKADATWIAKVAPLDGVIDDPAALGTKLRALAEFDEDLAGEIVKALEVADTRLAKSNLFTEFGKSGGVSGAEGKVEAIAKAYREADPTLSPEAARSKAYEENPDLYAEYLADRRAR